MFRAAAIGSALKIEPPSPPPSACFQRRRPPREHDRPAGRNGGDRLPVERDFLIAERAVVQERIAGALVPCPDGMRRCEGNFRNFGKIARRARLDIVRFWIRLLTRNPRALIAKAKKIVLLRTVMCSREHRKNVTS